MSLHEKALGPPWAASAVAKADTGAGSVMPLAGGFSIGQDACRSWGRPICDMQAVGAFCRKMTEEREMGEVTCSLFFFLWVTIAPAMVVRGLRPR